MLKVIKKIFLIFFLFSSSFLSASSPFPASKKVHIAKNLNELPDIVIGSETAPITLIEYSSINCSHCAYFHNKEFPQLKKNWIDKGKVKYVYRHFPLDDQAVLAMGIIAQLPPEQWYETICRAYLKFNEWSGEKMEKFARICGVEISKCKTVPEQKKLVESIMAKRFNAEKKYDIPATPAFVIIKEGKEELINYSISMENLEMKFE